MKLIAIIFTLFSISSFSTNFDNNRASFVKKLAGKISRNPRVELIELLKEAARFRREMAELDNDADADKFGVLREGSFVTPTGDYPITRFLLKEHLDVLRRSYISKEGLTRTISEDGAQMWTAKNYPISEERTSLALVNDNSFFGSIYMVHISAPNKALNKADMIFKKIITSNASMLRVSDFGKLHYWLAISTPYYRGTAAIAEIIVEALALSFKIHLIYPDFNKVIDAISSQKKIDSKFVKTEILTLKQEFQGAIEGRQVMDQFAHGSPSEKQFMKYYKKLIYTDRITGDL